MLPRWSAKFALGLKVVTSTVFSLAHRWTLAQLPRYDCACCCGVFAASHVVCQVWSTTGFERKAGQSCAQSERYPGFWYHEAVARSELLDWMCDASFVANTSLSEGMCNRFVACEHLARGQKVANSAVCVNSLLESMGVGTCVLAASNAGNRALLTANGASALAGACFDTPAEFVQLCCALLQDVQLRATLQVLCMTLLHLCTCTHD